MLETQRGGRQTLQMSRAPRGGRRQINKSDKQISRMNSVLEKMESAILLDKSRKAAGT